MTGADNAHYDKPVKVNRDDLAWALNYMTVDGEHGRSVKDRLIAALEEHDCR